MNDLFTKLGLSKKETEVFTKLLTLGAQPVSVIAKHVGMPRSSMYFVLDKLREQQLTQEFERAGITYVKCIPVAEIAGVLRQKEKAIHQTLAVLEENLPALQAMEQTLSIMPKVRFIEGSVAVSAMYDSFTREHDFAIFFSPESVQAIMPEYLPVIHNVVKESNAKAREIAVDSPLARVYQKKYHSHRHQIRLLPEGRTFASDCILCKDRICMVNYGEGQVAAVEIMSENLAKTLLVVFDQAWSTLKE